MFVDYMFIKIYKYFLLYHEDNIQIHKVAVARVYTNFGSTAFPIDFTKTSGVIFSTSCRMFSLRDDKICGSFLLKSNLKLKKKS